MSPPAKILVFSDVVDPHAERVMDCLQARGVESIVVHPSDLLRGFSITCEDSGESGYRLHLKTPGHFQIYSEEIIAVYFRGREPVRPPKSINDVGVARYAAQESEQNFRDILESIPGYWLTRPSVIRRAQSKALQLATAREVGLLTPRSLWSNDPEEILAFADSCDYQIVAKPVNDVEYYLGNRPHTVWVSPIDRESLLRNKENLSLMLGFYQQLIHDKTDVRVTAVGEELFPCEMIIKEPFRHITDWRMVPEPLDHQIVPLPEDIKMKLLAFNQRLGVDFGAIDLLKSPGGDYYFIESNINGQWLWIQDLTKQPIAEAIASLLISRSSTPKE